VVLTADHGEMGGAHGGLKGKGPFSYEANVHVPLIIAHPAARAGTACPALTSHLDLLPTFVGLTGLPEAERPQAVKALPGHDFSGLLADPERASVTAVRRPSSSTMSGRPPWTETSCAEPWMTWSSAGPLRRSPS
jgi:arylsulfatase